MKNPKALLVVVLATMFWLLSSASVLAQGRVRDNTPQSVLFQTCIHEASIPVLSEDEFGTEFWARTRDHSVDWGADCWIIHEVFLNGAHFLNREHHYEESLDDADFAALYVQFALRHSEAVFFPSPGDVNVWARELHPPFLQPASWTRSIPVCVDHVCSMRPAPGGHPFGRAQRAALVFAWALAGEIVTHDLASVGDWSACSAAVDTWGGRLDHEHAAMMGFVEVTCDSSANTGYAYPSRIRAREEQDASL